MAVLNQQRNQKGVQTLGLEFQELVAAGHGYMVPHTNGSTYCIFARNFDNAVQERRLFISVSSDHGATWSVPVQLTSGNWDDNPCGLQLNPLSTTSDIGIIFTRAASVTASNAQTMTRIGIDSSTFALTTPVDPITSSPTGFKYLSLVTTASGFAIFAINSAYAGSASVAKWTNTAFTTNTWAQTGLSNFWGGSTLNPYSLSVKRIANGDLGAISVVRTNLNGTNAANIGNQTSAIVRTDVFVSFSSDDGVTWSSPQNLTNYTASPDLDLIGLTNAFDADLAGLSDGSVVVAYQEGVAPQFITDSTTLALPGTAGGVNATIYHATHNLLIIGTSDVTNGGVWVFDLTAQTRTRIFSSGTPAIWGNSINDLALSFDDKYLCVAHTAGLEIIDTTSATISSWTVTPVRTTTTPASRVAPMFECQFGPSGYDLYVSYGTVSVTDVWGFKVDASNVGGGLIDLQSATGGGVSNLKFVQSGSDLVGITGAKVIKTFKSNGVSNYTSTISGSDWAAIARDDVNGEYVLFGTGASVDGLHRVTDSGSAFTIAQTFTTTSSASAPTGIVSFIGVVVGSGIYYQSGVTGAGNMGFYSFGQQKPMGFITYYRSDQAIGENNYNNVLQSSRVIKSGTWLATSTLNSPSLQLISLTLSGRIRYGFFPYNAGTKQLTTSGVDFFDMVNTVRVAPFTKLQKLRFAADNTDALMAYFRKVDLSVTVNQYAAVNGHVEPDAFKLFVRARILKNPSVTETMRARILAHQLKTIDIRARIVFAQCFYARAKIVPISVVTMQCRANIKGSKTRIVLNTFSVSRAGQTVVRMQFFAGNGNVFTQGMSMGAFIVKRRRTTMTGHFIVYNVQSGPIRFGFVANQSSLQQFGMKANIVRP